MPNSLEKKEYLRKYYLVNKEKIKANHKKYYEENKDYLYQKTVQWKLDNPEKVKEYRQDWSANNKIKELESKRNWEKRNPEYVNAKNRRRRAIKKGSTHVPYTEAQVLELYGANCYLCNSPIDLVASRKGVKPGWEFGLHIDHVVPIISGGPDRLENVRPTHAICNLRKGSGMSFEPEIDEDLFDEAILAADAECDCGDDCICEEYEFDDDIEELEDLDEEWEEE